MSESRGKKRIQIPSKPQADEWVSEGVEKGIDGAEQKMKRLTLDLPENLHRAIKRRAVEDGVSMVDMLRKLLNEQYGQAV